MKKIKKVKDLKVDESYLVYMGYSYSPSGWDIGTFTLRGNFEMQACSETVAYTDESIVYELPIVEQ